MEISKLILDWPVLATASFWILLVLFYKQILIRVQKGGMNIKLGELSMNFEQAEKDMSAELEELAARIGKLEAPNAAVSMIRPQNSAIDMKRVYQSLFTVGPEGRSVIRLSTMLGVSPEEMREALGKHDDIIFSRNAGGYETAIYSPNKQRHQIA